MDELPKLIEGGISVDDRGVLSYVNDFNLGGVKRFYTVMNYSTDVVRAWHGHKYEAKYITALFGAAIVGAVRINNWEKPSPDCMVVRHVLSSAKPQVFYVPPGYCNGWMALVANTVLGIFSTLSFEESKADDVRFHGFQWDIWSVRDR